MSFIDNVNKIANEMPNGGFVEYTQRLESLEAKEEFTEDEKSKLQNIQSEATKNDSDNNLKNRENHTGKQSLDTITETATKKIFTNVEKEQLQLLDGHNHDLRYYKKSESNEQMSNKSDTGHTHDDRYFTETEITSLLNAYALALNTFTKEEMNQFLNAKENANNKNMANGYAGLDASGRIYPSNLPSMSIMDVFGASSEAGMLALSNVGIGDLCVRGDLASNNVFLCKQTPSSDINNWIQLTTSANVSSVNGKIGTVSLNASDIGLGNVDNTRDADKPVSNPQQEALDNKVDKVAGKGLSTNDFTNELFTLLNTKKVKSVTTDAVNNRLVITYTDDTVANLNLADIVNDIYVDGATLDATTNVLTLSSSSGGSNVTVNLSDFVNSAELNNIANQKQNTLVSAINIKTINGDSILGSGNIGCGNLSTTSISLAGNGYMRLSNGFIIQWGTQTPPANAVIQTYNFPITFPTSCLNFDASLGMGGNTGTSKNDGTGGKFISSSQYQMGQYTGGSAIKMDWIAIGY